MKEGFLIGGGLILLGLILELCIGPVVWETFAWPVNGLMMAFLLAVIVVMFLLRKKVYVFRFISTYQAAIPALAYAVVLTIIMGLTRQMSLTHGSLMNEGSLWINYMLNFWPFVLIYVYIAVILGQIILRRTINCQLSTVNLKRDVPFLLNHFGLFLAMTAATLGNADMQRLKMITTVGETEWRAMTQEGAIREMPFTIELKQFIMETYDDGSPKRFASKVKIQTKSGKNYETTIDVNKPVAVDGWKIYQYDYDKQMGAMSQISILELVSDPWLPLVYIGIYMMLGGAVCFILLSIPWVGGWRQTRKHPKRAFTIAVVIAAAFFCVHHFMPILHSDTLVPALQSPWFKPHIIAYMLAYTLMASVAVIALYILFRMLFKDGNHNFQFSIINFQLDNLVFIGISLITIGMLFGALWAKEAWGHYWSWDPKETWAAITWFAYLVYIHYRQLPKHKPHLALWLLIISFVLLQMCWWGINYLPSAQGASVHTYTM